MERFEGENRAMLGGGELLIYGAHWCPDCRTSKQFLGEHQIPYTWIDIENDAEAEARVIELNQGKRIIPTILFPDGSRLVEPSNAELAAKLGLRTEASRSHYRTIVIGGGPAGLTAALYLAREGEDVLVVERAAFGGQASITARIDNMPGFPYGISGADFAERLRIQAERFGVELMQAQEVSRITTQGRYHRVETESGQSYSAAAVILAMGSRYRRLGIPGEERLIGSGVHFCATCDGPFYRGEHVVVVGGGNSALEEAELLTKYADRITMLVRGEAFRGNKIAQEAVIGDPRISVRYGTEVKAFEGERGKLTSLVVSGPDSASEERIEAPAAFIFIGLDPYTEFLRDSAVRMNEWGFVITGHDLMHNRDKPAGFAGRQPSPLETSVPGVFAAGDVREGSSKQIVSALGEGASVALGVRDYLKSV